MLGESILRLLPDDRLEEETQLLERIVRGETVDYIDSIRKRKNGKLINVSLLISPILDANNRVVGASKIARDVTEKELLERQLHQSQKMEAIGQLTGGIAHDFNNLLGIVVGNLDLLERMTHSDPTGDKRVKTAQKAVARGADLTRRLLVLSSSEDLNPVTIRIEDSIKNVVEMATRTLGPEISIRSHFDPTIPMVFADMSGLETALLNLAVNARDAMPKGGTLTIGTNRQTLGTSYAPVIAGEIRPGTYICVSVTDTGCGMSPETLERAFEPFYTTKPRGKGTGLGLAMVYGFVKQSGGTIRLYSEEGIGTTVSLYLPLPEVHLQPIPAAPDVEEWRRAGHSGTVLVVDDEEDMLEVAVAFLEEMGFTALHAGNGVTALQVAVRNDDIDLLVTDVIMPGGMNGMELAHEFRKVNPKAKIIYSSGFPANALAERSGSAVDGPVLRKPYRRAEFATIVHGAMERE